MTVTSNLHVKAFIVRATATWLMFIPIAFINGAIRELILKRYMAELAAHMASCFMISLAIIAAGYFMLRRFASGTGDRTLWITGAIWVFMTILFEFFFGHYISGISWETLLHDYNLVQGRLWSLVLAAIFITPIGTKKIVNRPGVAGLPALAAKDITPS
jgi:hypothetical protein